METIGTLRIERISTIQGVLCNGFFVRNRANKVLAIGAVSTESKAGFVLMKAKRYSKDVPLCESIYRLTGGLPIKSGFDPLPVAAKQYGKDYVQYLNRKFASGRI